jgi:exopolysaccharide/PEP-CTERM locus tyrosine autokinase
MAGIGALARFDLRAERLSKIQDALKKLQKDLPARPDPSVPASMGMKYRKYQSAIPAARQKKVTIEGEKHHVNQEDLIRGGLLAHPDLGISVADEFRRIKRPILDNALRKGPEAADQKNVVLIASALPRAGKTFCSVNLAVSISLERELHVLLVDADVVKPHISREFGLAKRRGLIDLLLEDSLQISDCLVRTDINDIQILPAGTKHARSTELLASERMSAIITELSSRYPDRIILLDSPPLLATSEALSLADQVGQIAIVVECGETTHHSLTETLALLNPEKATNIILNKSWRSMQSGYYGGGYG